MLPSPTPLSGAIRRCAPALAAAFVLSLFINATLLVSPIYSMQVYDRVLSSRNLGTLLFLTLIVGAFLTLYGLLEYARSGILIRAGAQFEASLRTPLFEALMRARQAGAPYGQQLIREAEAIREVVSTGTVATLCDLPWTPVFVLLCFVLHPLLGVVALLGALALFLLALATEYATKSSVEQTNRLAGNAHAVATSALRNCEVVRGLGMGDVTLERWSRAQSAAVALQAQASERGAALLAMSKFARLAVQTMLLCAGAWLAIDRQISPGTMMAAVIIMGRALAPVEQTVGQWKRIVTARAAYRRLQKLLQEFPAPAVATELPAPVGRIAVENIAVCPPTSKSPAVQSVSLTLEPGEILAVIGASASGKSSLARALCGVWPLAQGTIRIDGAAYTQWDATRLGKHIGYLPQDIELFSGTVSENIARLGPVDDAAVISAAKFAGAHEVILRLPNGYDTQIGDGGMALSGGMRQRVGLARALYGNPRLIVLDEPNSNLDEEGEKALGLALARLKVAQRTIVVVTHRPQILAHVDRLLVMSFGKVLACGPRDAVVARMRGGRVAAVETDTEQRAAQAS